MQIIKRLGRDYVLYGLGLGFSHGLPFLLLPVFTRILTPGEYGAVELLTSLGLVFASIMDMGQLSAQGVYFFQNNPGQAGRSALVTSVFGLRGASGLAALALALPLAPLLGRFFSLDGVTVLSLGLALVAAYCFQVLLQGQDLLRLTARPYLYVAIAALHALLASTGAIGLIRAGLGYRGYFLGFAVASSLCAVVLWYSQRAFLAPVRQAWSRWRECLRFGLPLLPAALAMDVLCSVDRWLVARFLSPEELGLYAVAYRFALVMGMAVAAFRQAWFPIAMQSLWDEEGERLFRDVSRYYLGAAVAGVLALTAAAPYLFRLMAPAQYASAAPLVGVLAWYPVCFGLYALVGCAILRAEKTWLAAVVTAAGAAANVALGWVLIPAYGLLGAAVSSALSFSLWIVLTLAVGSRLWPVRFPLASFAGLALLGGGGVALLNSLNAAQDRSPGVTGAVLLALLALVGAVSLREEMSALVSSRKKG